MTGDESQVLANTDAVTAPIRANLKQRSGGIRSRGAGVKACHHSSEKSFRGACFRSHPWGLRRGRDGPRSGRAEGIRPQRVAKALLGASGVSASLRLVECAKS
jgi:hypothetical protein